MRIEFDPTNRDEATAVRAVLAVMYPEAPRYDPTTQPGTLRFEEQTEVKVHSEDGGMTVNLTDGTVTVATETDSVPDLDANNEPHDPRIHSTPAKTNADGTWRAKRGVTADVVAAVRAEREALVTPEGLAEAAKNLSDAALTALENGQSPFPAPRAEGGPLAPGPIASNEGTESFVASEAPKAPTPPAPPSPNPDLIIPAGDGQTSVHGVAAPSFLDVMKAITAAQKAGKVDTAKVKELCAAIGAGDSTMGLNGADKGELRVQFMALLDGEVGE